MKELIRTSDIVLISALKAALSAEDILAFEFDGDIASTYGGIDTMPRRLMVADQDHAEALEIAKALFPKEYG